jgi:hypothetical protein
MADHLIVQRANGEFWCNTERVVTEQCTDPNRCAQACSCNVVEEDEA